MDRLRTLRTFISVAEHRSFAEAGRRLSLSPTTVSRTIAALETSLGVQLLRRTTRSVSLTEEGALFLDHCRAGISEIEQAYDVLQGRRSAPSGLLTVTAPVLFGRLHIQPAVTQLLASFPELRVRLLLLDRVVSLVEEGVVTGWDDPRMPTLVGMRRRGFTPSAIRDFIDRVGLSKADSVVDYALLEYCVRNDLGNVAPRVMAVLQPLKVILTNWPEDKVDTLPIENHPDHPEMGERHVTFGRELWIDREDFMEDPPRKFFRLAPGREVRLKGAYIIKCEEVIKDEHGKVVALHCTVDMDSRSGSPGAERKVKGTLQWVNAGDAAPVEARLYEPLLDESDENEDIDRKDFMARINPNSLIVQHGYAEHAVAEEPVGWVCQFLRVGYFCKDRDSTDALPVMNRVVPLKDSYRP